MRRRLTLAAYVAALTPYVVLVGAAGLENVWRGMVIESLKVPAERHLPLIANGMMGQASFAALVVALSVAIVIVGLISLRRNAEPRLTRTVLLLGLLCLGSVPEFLQRSDTAHLATLGGVVAGSVPVAACLLSRTGRRIHGVSVPTALAATLTVLVVGGLTSEVGLLHEYKRQLSGAGVSYAVRNEGRTWYYPPTSEVAWIRQLLAVADGLAAAGGPLFVGTQDLSETSYVDDSFYFPSRSSLSNHTSTTSIEVSLYMRACS